MMISYKFHSLLHMFLIIKDYHIHTIINGSSYNNYDGEESWFDHEGASPSLPHLMVQQQRKGLGNSNSESAISIGPIMVVLILM
jgi:hypothetical protein